MVDLVALFCDVVLLHDHEVVLDSVDDRVPFGYFGLALIQLDGQFLDDLVGIELVATCLDSVRVGLETLAVL